MEKHGRPGMAHGEALSKRAGFPGFQAPFYTMVPNELFDLLLPELSGAELKVLLYVVRRTFGFGKVQDGISLSQMEEGVRSRDGKVLDSGCGVKSKTSILVALKALVEKNILLAMRQQSTQHGHEPTMYRLNVVETEKRDPPCTKN